MSKEIVLLSENEKNAITKNIKSHFFIGIFPILIFLFFFTILIQETFKSEFSFSLFLYIFADFILISLIYVCVDYFYVKPYYHINSKNKTIITSKIKTIQSRIRHKRGIQFIIECDEIVINNFQIHFLNIHNIDFDYNSLKVGDMLNIEFIENHPEKILFMKVI